MLSVDPNVPENDTFANIAQFCFGLLTFTLLGVASACASLLLTGQ